MPSWNASRYSSAVAGDSRRPGPHNHTAAIARPNAGTNAIQITGIQALGVERETGFLCLVARPPLQVSERSATELLSRIDVRELPEWGGRVDPATVLAYRYLRPGYSLAVDARHFDARDNGADQLLDRLDEVAL